MNRDVCTLSRHSALRNQGATRRQLNGENFNLNIVKSEVRGMLGHTEAGHPDCGEERRPFYRTVLKLLIWSEDWQRTEYNWGRGVFVYLLLDPFTSGVVYHCQNVRVTKHSPPRPVLQPPSFLPLPMRALRNVQSTLQRSDLTVPSPPLLCRKGSWHVHEKQLKVKGQ